MSNVKLVVRTSTDISTLVEKLKHNSRVKFARVRNKNSAMKLIFRNYDKILILIYNRRDLLVPDWVYVNNISPNNLPQIIDNICSNVTTRCHSPDNVNYYDTFKIWHHSADLPKIRISVDRLFMRQYGYTANQPWPGRDLHNMWGDGPISADDFARINNAELKYPILLYPNYDNIDGLHRLAKAKKEGRKYISCVIVPANIMRKCKINGWVSYEEYSARFTC